MVSLDRILGDPRSHFFVVFNSNPKEGFVAL